MRTRLIALAIGATLTVLNIIALSGNWSIAAKAKVAGMNYSELINDSDFRRAVATIVQDCHLTAGRDITC